MVLSSVARMESKVHKMVDLLAISLADMTVVCLVPLRVVLMVWKRELWLAVMRVCKQVGRLAQDLVLVKVAKKVVSRVDSMDLRLVTLLVTKMVLRMVS